MNDWTSGYVSDIGYTYGYYNELNPNRARIALLNNGILCPKFSTGCELGFGQGISANIHAAASNCKWYGTDFNPSQASFAQQLALAAESDAKFFDESFAEFSNRTDLPEFDYIGLHGIWSWVSQENRETIVRFIQKKLKVGGVVYISYNTHPGWTTFSPIRQLMAQHADLIGSPGDSTLDRVAGSLSFIDSFLKTNPAFIKENPKVVERIETLKTQDKNYLAHEYFNRDWSPAHFAEVAEILETAKLSFVCSATYLSQLDQLNISKDQIDFLSGIPNMTLRQSVRDIMANTQFRQDYWMKGPVKMTPLEQIEAFKEESIILTTFRDDISLKITCPLGEAVLDDKIYGSVLDLLSDYKPHTISDIFESVKNKGVQLPQIIEAVITLVHNNHLASARSGKKDESIESSSHKLNDYLMHLSRSRPDLGFLASPATGGGIYVHRVHQLFILALKEGMTKADELANYCWRIMESQGHQVFIEGKPLADSQDSIDELNHMALEFIEKRMPVLKGLDVIAHN
jgi:hypothetical protein